MTDRVDKKLGTVVLANYAYRHEAEFAAGFLEEAGIPYRLQIEDATLGLRPSNSATIWVRGMDLREAREVLELPRHGTAEGGSAGAGEVGNGGDTPPVTGRGPAARGTAVVTLGVHGHRPPSAGRVLTGRERLVALTMASGVGGLAWLAGVGGGWVGLALGTLAGSFVIAAAVGRSLSLIEGLVRAVAGSAP